MKVKSILIISFFFIVFLYSCTSLRLVVVPPSRNSNILYMDFAAKVIKIVEHPPFNFVVTKSVRDTILFEDNYLGKWHGIIFKDRWNEKTIYTIIYEKSHDASNSPITKYSISSETIESPNDEFVATQKTAPSKRPQIIAITDKL